MMKASSSVGRQMLAQSLTVRDIVKNSASMMQLSKVLKPGDIKSALDLAITELSMSLNTKYNLTDLQLKSLVDYLYEQYKYESLEDIVYCLNMAKRGAYGIIYSLDAATISQWLSIHLENKAAEREAMQQSANNAADKKLTYEEWLKEQPQWFKDLTKEEQNEVLKQVNDQWYKQGAEYLKRINAIRDKKKQNGLQFHSAEKEAAYRKFRAEFIKDYWENKNKQSNDKIKTRTKGQQKRGSSNTANKKD